MPDSFIRPDTILIASDHAGISLKETLIKAFGSEYKIEDLGTHTEASCDYPDYAEKLCHELLKRTQKNNTQKNPPEKVLGILICGTGIGMSIAANKIHGIRAAHVENTISAKLTREHNHSQVLCLGARITEAELAQKIVKTWLETKPSEDLRHIQRIEKTMALEKPKKGSTP